MTHGNVLIVEDDEDLREALIETVHLAGIEGASANNGKSALKLLKEKSYSVVVSDVQMDEMDGHELLNTIRKDYPQTPVILITAHGTVNDAVNAMHVGAVDYLSKPFEPDVLMRKIQHFIGPKEIETSQPVARDPASLQLLTLAKRVATTDATVLISGESGTGKEVLARYIHDHSNRADKQFIAINCAAIPENMLEATLFGYEKGAFTGAYKSTAGKFEDAQDGTLLLDEISEMDLALQAKILRVLQEREVERIGSKKIIKLNVRVLATTNRHMQEEVKAGSFREDLYYRLNVFPLEWSPLRERTKDIIPMAQYLLHKHCQEPSVPQLTEKAIAALKHYKWPGNAREMDNVIQRAMILQQGNTIDVNDLHLDPSHQVQIKECDKSTDHKNTVKDHEYQIIINELDKFNGSRTEVAKSLDMSPRTLRYKLSKMRDAGYDV